MNIVIISTVTEVDILADVVKDTTKMIEQSQIVTCSVTLMWLDPGEVVHRCPVRFAVANANASFGTFFTTSAITVTVIPIGILDSGPGVGAAQFSNDVRVLCLLVFACVPLLLNKMHTLLSNQNGKSTVTAHVLVECGCVRLVRKESDCPMVLSLYHNG
jgi:hypothetical protein